ncbi:MAG: hypothetical protein QOC82_2015 [Frankiaceae bacterium]|nr:hypothetical protein [Frankiaceae bacterium]
MPTLSITTDNASVSNAAFSLRAFAPIDRFVRMFIAAKVSTSTSCVWARSVDGWRLAKRIRPSGVPIPERQKDRPPAGPEPPRSADRSPSTRVSRARAATPPLVQPLVGIRPTMHRAALDRRVHQRWQLRTQQAVVSRTDEGLSATLRIEAELHRTPNRARIRARRCRWAAPRGASRRPTSHRADEGLDGARPLATQPSPPWSDDR